MYQGLGASVRVMFVRLGEKASQALRPGVRIEEIPAHTVTFRVTNAAGELVWVTREVPADSYTVVDHGVLSTAGDQLRAWGILKK